MAEDNRIDVRFLARKSLVSLLKDGKYSNIEIDSSLSESDLPDKDKALYTRLVYGVTEKKLLLDYIISLHSSRSVDDIDIPSLVCIEIGLYQLLFTDRIPDFAAVSSAVDIAPPKTKGFVNGILRSFLRNEKKYPLPSSMSERDISVRHSVSESIAEVLKSSYGPEKCEKILTALNTEKGICLRINTLKTDKAEAQKYLEQNNIGYKESLYTDDIIIVNQMNGAVRRGLADGLWFVQDEASCITAKIISPEKDDIIIDTCASPGGKSFSLAIDKKDKGRILSFDLHKNKLSLIEKGANTLGITCIKTAENDARRPIESLIGTADKVLCDAPCSGIGVIGKKPEIRYKNSDSFSSLPEIQAAVLRGASEYVKIGGFLYYSTCTLNTKENEETVLNFVKSNPCFTLCDFTFGNISSQNGMVTLFPDETGTDGFFISKMQKQF